MTLDEILRRRIARHFPGTGRAPDVVTAARRVGGLHAQVASSARDDPGGTRSPGWPTG